MDSPEYIPLETQELFERFLMGGMDDNERSAFLESLEGDSELDQRFKMFKSTFRAVEEAGLRTSMEQYHSKIEGSGKGSHRSGRITFYRIAASVAVLVALGLWFLLHKTPNERLYQQYFIADPGLPTVMGSADNYDFQEAMVEYKQGNYATAIAKWETLLSQNRDNDTLNYFLGSAHLARGDAHKAIGYMQKALSVKESAFVQDLHFYLGLAYLKENKATKALEHLSRCGEGRCEELKAKIEI